MKQRYAYRPPMKIARKESKRSGGPLAKSVGARLQDIRIERGLTQKKLGELAGMCTSRIGDIEGGYNSPTLTSLEKVLRALGQTEFVIVLTALDDAMEAEANGE